MDLEEVARKVSAEIENYVYGYIDNLTGGPWSPERIEIEVRAFRSALVQPYWVEITRQDTIEEIVSVDPPTCRCVVVADDRKGVVLAFDPAAAEFLLAKRNADRMESYGVSGDAVGCFLAR